MMPRHTLVVALLAVGLLGACTGQTGDTEKTTDQATEPGKTPAAATSSEPPAGEPDGAETTIENPTEEDKTMTTEANYFEIKTPLGRMVVRLYDETPIHRDNFRKLVSEDYYNGTTFHRVIEGFMIQGGDGLSKDDDPLNDGMGEIGYTLDAEIQDGLFHKKGALAAARQGDQVNPQRRSSGSQFYIVQGTVSTEEELAELERQMRTRVSDFALSEDAKKAYMTVGGTPFLDGQYTVFGEVVEGMDVLDAIAATNTAGKTGERVHPALKDRPTTPITMEVRALENYPS